ncbi:MAG: DUF3427 domain-containing protein [Planctomycetota bacterium]|nr:DUF3427 domain-containing protein [Planctomycetota bacterium]
MSQLPDGLYEQLVTLELQARLAQLGASHRRPQLRKLDRADSAEVLAHHVASEMRRLLPHLHASEGDLVEQQLRMCNQIIELLRTSARDGTRDVEIVPPAQQLLSVSRESETPARPTTPLSHSELLTGAKGEPRLGAELFAELASADSVDILVSFIKWQGIRRLREALEKLARDGKPLRVLTTTYMGASETVALDWLARLPNTQVRISHDHRRTRLHAKAWLFRRESGFHTAYVGSANVSASALDSGLEWTLKACQADAPHIIERFRGAFESLWEDGEFEAYDPDNPASRARVENALADARGARPDTSSSFALKLEPFPFQQEILDQLQAERELRGHTHNLVVSATGTGKTMVAAFDYRRQIGVDGLRPRLLFVAHREELLGQALNSFRHVLRDGSFGEILKGGSNPSSHDHLFATIQSLQSRDLLAAYGESHWDYVVVDEFHHAAAATYRRLLDGIRPRILLGLTATPERADGLDILHWFDGRVAAEIRLWDALERQLLTPFEYYGIHDNTDLRGLRWSRGGYDTAELEGIYTGNDMRAALVLEQFTRFHGHPRAARVLGFCVGVEHAKFMAETFNQAGIPSIAVHGGSNTEERAGAIRRLRERDINVIFTCDLYNEGVDIPEADCLLLLRPTESPTVFLQQLGRGLRLSAGKSSTLVLDFIGQMHQKYRVDLKLRALTGIPRGKLAEAVEHGFPSLPSGCHMQLDRESCKTILENLKQAVKPRRTQLALELKELTRERGTVPTLAAFLEAQGLELSDLYEKRIGGWSALLREAGLLPASSAAPDLGARLERILHVDDPARLELFLRALDGDAPHSEAERRQLLMLGFRLARADQLDDVTPDWPVKQLLADSAIADECRQFCCLKLENLPLAPARAAEPADWPLHLHRRYQRDEILTAVGEWTPARRRPFREGVLWLKEHNTELFLVTLNKSEKHFSPTTRYADYAISERLFHWQSQSTVSADSPTGRRYREQASNGARFLLFVRENPSDAYAYLGPVRYQHHEGSRPMSITWLLESPLPAALLRRYATLRTG